MNLNTFFKDLIIVELASVLAGPAVGSFFAELGAKVIKIENKKTNGDMTRHWRLPNESQETPFSAYYCSVNFNKEALLLDLSQEKDYSKVLAYIKQADIIISNFHLDTAKKLKVDEITLRQYNPTLIYAQLTAFGAESTRPAFDMVLQAEAGFLYMCGEANRPPVKMPVALIDILAAHQLKEALLIALIHRMKTGEGSFVSTSLLESAIASLANQASNWLMTGHIPQRMGTQHPNIAPYGDIFLTKDDKPILLAIGTTKQWANFCTCLEIPSIFEDSRFHTNTARLQNRETLLKTLSPIFKKYDSQELINHFEKNNVPYASIRTMPEVFELDEAQAMVLEREEATNFVAKSVKTVAFTIQKR